MKADGDLQLKVSVVLSETDVSGMCFVAQGHKTYMQNELFF